MNNGINIDSTLFELSFLDHTLKKDATTYKITSKRGAGDGI